MASKAQCSNLKSRNPKGLKTQLLRNHDVQQNMTIITAFHVAILSLVGSHDLTYVQGIIIAQIHAYYQLDASTNIS
jgi:hypothetical protein